MRIIKARNIRGISQNELALKSGLNLDLILSFENDLIKPKATQLCKLGDALDASCDYLLGIYDFIDYSQDKFTPKHIDNIKLMILNDIDLDDTNLSKEGLDNTFDIIKTILTDKRI